MANRFARFQRDEALDEAHIEIATSDDHRRNDCLKRTFDTGILNLPPFDFSYIGEIKLFHIFVPAGVPDPAIVIFGAC